MSKPGTGLSYRSKMSGRLLKTDINVNAISPMLREGGPVRPEDAAHLARVPDKPIGSFTIAARNAGVPTALIPLATVRGAAATPIQGASIAYSPGARAAAGTVYADDDSDAVSAGSYAFKGVATSDPDGISAAVSTLRRFRKMLEDEQGKTKGAPPIFAPEQERPLKIDLMAAEALMDASGGGGIGRRQNGGGGNGGEFQQQSTKKNKPILDKAPTDLASQIAATAHGTSVVGTLIVEKKYLMKVTMIAAKWTRIVDTRYGASAQDPAAMVVELSRQYYTAFLDDLHEATGGNFTFKTEPAPTTMVANVGAINLMLKLGETDFTEHLLPPQESNIKQRFKVVGGDPRMRALAGQPDLQYQQAALEAGGSITMSGSIISSGGGSMHSGGGSNNSGAIVPYKPGASISSVPSSMTGGGEMVPFGKLRRGSTAFEPGQHKNGGSGAIVKAAGSMALSSPGSPRAGGGDGDGGPPMTLMEQSDALKQHYEAPLVYKGTVTVSKAILDSQDYLVAKQKTLLRAGRIMRKAAIKGDTKILTKLVIKGEPVYFDPRPWYLRDPVQQDNPEGDTPQNNPAVVQTDSKVTVPLDWFEPHDGMTALMHACQSSTPESVRVLLEMGSNPHRKNRFGVNSIDIAKASMERAAEALKARVRGAGEFRRRAAEVMSLLDTRTIWETARDGDKNRLRVLLNTGKADVNATNPYGMTALHFAVINHDFEAVEMLVVHGGNPHAKNNLGQTPLSLADEVERPGTKARLMEAFTGGKAEDAVRREKDRDRLTREAEEKALLIQFERKLKTLTRGTTAAKTLRTLNKITKDAQQQAGAERPGTTRPGTGTRAASSPGGRRPGTSASSRPVTVSAARAQAMGFATGMEGYGQPSMTSSMMSSVAPANQPPMSPFAMDRSKPETTWRNGQLSITMAEPVRYSGSAQSPRGRSASPTRAPGGGPGEENVDGMYAASHQRHARAFVSLAMKEQQQAEARSLGAALSRGVTEVSKHQAPSLMIRPGATDEELTAHAMEAIAHAKAPHPADRKFDVWFSSVTAPDGKR